MGNLTWTKSGDQYLLASPKQELVKLRYQSIGKTTFWLNEVTYEVKRSEFSNRRYTVYASDQQVLSLRNNFWGSKGIIQFPDGTQYLSDYTRKNTLTLHFLDPDTEILSYSVETSSGRQQVVLNLGWALLDADRLLLLATLGMVIFLNIFNEFNDGGDGADAFSMLTDVSS